MAGDLGDAVAASPGAPRGGDGQPVNETEQCIMAQLRRRFHSLWCLVDYDGAGHQRHSNDRKAL